MLIQLSQRQRSIKKKDFTYSSFQLTYRNKSNTFTVSLSPSISDWNLDDNSIYDQECLHCHLKGQVP